MKIAGIKVLLIIENFQSITCTYYLIQIRQQEILSFINSQSDVNATHLQLTKQLEFLIWQTRISTEIVDGMSFKKFGIIIKTFEVNNKEKSLMFFNKFLN